MKYPIEWRNPKTKKSSSHKNTSTLLSSIIWIAVFACVFLSNSYTVFTSSSPGPNSQQMKLLVISFLPVQNVEFCNFSLQSPFHGWISYVDGRGYEIYAYICHRNLPTVGEYTISYMDGIGLFWRPTGSPQAHGDRESPFFCQIVRLRDVSRPKRLMIVWKLRKQRLWGWFPIWFHGTTRGTPPEF